MGAFAKVIAVYWPQVDNVSKCWISLILETVRISPHSLATITYMGGNGATYPLQPHAIINKSHSFINYSTVRRRYHLLPAQRYIYRRALTIFCALSLLRTHWFYAITWSMRRARFPGRLTTLSTTSSRTSSAASAPYTSRSVSLEEC